MIKGREGKEQRREDRGERERESGQLTMEKEENIRGKVPQLTGIKASHIKSEKSEFERVLKGMKRGKRREGRGGERRERESGQLTLGKRKYKKESIEFLSFLWDKGKSDQE